MQSYLFVATVIILLSLECRGVMRDKQMRSKKTVEIVWAYVDWGADACDNFANFACKDFNNAIGNYSCKNGSKFDGLLDNSTDLKSEKTRQKRQRAENLMDDVEKRLENKLREIVEDKTIYVEPGVRKFATIYQKFITNWEDSEQKVLLRRVALLSVCDQMEEYSENVQFFNNHLPEMLDAAKVIGRHIRTQAELREIIANLDSNTRETQLAEIHEILTKAFARFDTDIPDLTLDSFTKFVIENVHSCDIAKLKDYAENLFWNTYYDYSANHKVNLSPMYFLSPTFSSEYTYAHFFGGVLSTFFHELGHAITWDIEESLFYKCVQEEIEQTILTWECPDEYIKNAKNLTDEVVADKLGIAMAWYTYQKYFKYLDSQDIDFGGNKLTRDQVFFISAGLDYCSETDNNLNERIAVAPGDEHILGRNRANLMMYSVPEFFNVFYCNDAKRTQCPILLKDIYDMTQTIY